MASPLRRAISRARSPVPASPPQSLQSAADTLIPPAPTRQNVHVTVRIRPPNATELSRGETEVFEIDSAGHVSLETGFMERNRKPQTEFNFDAVSSGSNNILLFERSVKETVKATMEGYNGTVFAYGQTSSGKTYTMTGTSEKPGVITQAVETVFDYISKCTSKGFLLRVSYMEIYNETVRDLLSPETQDLRIHEDKRRGVYVSPLKEHVVTSPKQVLKAITLGEENRHMGATDWNERSSRSHTIFQMVIESTDKDSADGGGLHLKRYSVGGPKLSGSSVTMSVLNLIDLAGSEKAATSVDRRKEGAFINKSLLTLGSVISKLTDTTGGHVPFRDSKLTRILQNSLSGNARVAVICTISPSAINFEESLNTLKFAARVKKVVTKAQTNQILDDSALIKKYRAEIEELKAQLAVTESKIQASEDLADTVQVGALKNTIEQERAKYLRDHEEWQLTQTALRERIDHLTKLILTNDSLPASKAVVDHKNALQSKDTTAQKLSALESTISQRDAEIASLKSQLQDKNKLLHDGSATLLDTADVGSGALQELEQLNRQLNDTVDEQQHTISVMESENAQSAAAITEHKNIIASLEEKAAAADDKIADFTKEIDALSQEKDTILLEVEKLRQEVTDLRRQKPHAEASDVKMNGHTRTGSGRDFSSSPEYTELSKTIQRQRSRITSLEEELKQSKQIIATQKEQLHRAELLQLEKGGKWARGNGMMGGASQRQSWFTQPEVVGVTKGSTGDSERDQVPVNCAPPTAEFLILCLLCLVVILPAVPTVD